MGDVLSTSSDIAVDHPLESELIEERDATVFSVLAERARGHPAAHLWGAALFGAADAVAVLIAYPAAWWIATAAMMLCAFGIWGLADEAVMGHALGDGSGRSPVAARVVRASAVGFGVLAALATTFGFIAAALGTLQS
jgi:hypothetical protein